MCIVNLSPCFLYTQLAVCIGLMGDANSMSRYITFFNKILSVYSEHVATYYNIKWSIVMVIEMVTC